MTKAEFIADFMSRLYQVMRDTAVIAEANNINPGDGIPGITLEMCIATHKALENAKSFFPAQGWTKALQIYLDTVENGPKSAATIHGLMDDKAE